MCFSMSRNWPLPRPKSLRSRTSPRDRRLQRKTKPGDVVVVLFLGAAAAAARRCARLPPVAVAHCCWGAAAPSVRRRRARGAATAEDGVSSESSSPHFVAGAGADSAGQQLSSAAARPSARAWPDKRFTAATSLQPRASGTWRTAGARPRPGAGLDFVICPCPRAAPRRLLGCWRPWRGSGERGGSLLVK